MTHTVIGTAGHIDHGKTALVKALTGIDTDRLKEEKEREITIDLGFAHLDDTIAFIDVPGHERFVKNMVAGVTGIDLAMLVVAADDGIMPQTREHLDIIRLLDIQKLVVALTKTDLADKDWTALVRAEIQAFVGDYGYTGAPIVPVSSITGAGISELKNVLIAEAETVRERQLDRPFRFPVDRSFSMSGFGTVVTGTVVSGILNSGDALELVNQQRTIRLRGMQRHNKKVQRLQAGERGALNVSGLQKDDIGRGDVIAHAGYFLASSSVTCMIQILASSRGALKFRERIRFHCGTEEILGRAVLLKKELLEPGETGAVQFQLEKPLVAAPGDRFIIRHYSPAVTIGGGEIIEVDAPPPGKKRASTAEKIRTLHPLGLDERISTFVAFRGLSPLTTSDIARQFGVFKDHVTRILTQRKEAVIEVTHAAERYWISRPAFTSFMKKIIENVEGYHSANPAKPAMKRSILVKETGREIDEMVWKRALDTLTENGSIVLHNDRIKMRSFEPTVPAGVHKTGKKLAALLHTKGLGGKTVEEIAEILDAGRGDIETLLDIAIDDGTVKLVGKTLFYTVKELGEIEKLVRDLIQRNGSLTIAEFRTALNTSRKYALPLLNYFDDHGVTVRTGDTRILQ